MSSEPEPQHANGEIPDGLLGSTVPRIWTQPLISGLPGPCGCGCALTPDTSYGFDVASFADEVIGMPLDPWERWAVIHAGELLPDGRPRFRQVLLLVARQNGKTHLLVVLTSYWLWVAEEKMILGTSTILDYARESWEKVVEIQEENQDILPVPKNGVRRANGEQVIRTDKGCKYKIGTASRKGGRSLTINRLVADELREHRDWSAYNASLFAMNAVPSAQAWFLSNAGDAESVVLNSLQDSATEYIETGDGDRRLGLFEWSATPGCEIDDPYEIAQANPNVGRRADWDTLMGSAKAAKTAGGKKEAGFRTEVLCQRVEALEPALDMTSWDSTAMVVDLSPYRSLVSLAIDLSPDGLHGSCYAAAVINGTVHIDPVAEWAGAGTTSAMRRELPMHIKRIRPRTVGWAPSGPIAAIGVEFAGAKWVPSGTTMSPAKTEMPPICMGFADLIKSGDIVHSPDPMLAMQAVSAKKLKRGDTWVFTRAEGFESAWVDAVYAAAIAVHQARSAPNSGGHESRMV